MSVDLEPSSQSQEAQDFELTKSSLKAAGISSLEKQIERYEQATSARRTYHDKDGKHVKQVVRRALTVADILGASPLEQALIEYAAYKHDYQASEEYTAQSATEELQALKNQERIPGVTYEQIKEVASAIKKTKVTFTPVSLDQENEYTTAIQPEFEKSKSKIEIALMIADLGAILIDGPEAHLEDAAALFFEIYKYDPPEPSSIDKGKLTEEAIKWFSAQADFAAGRMVQTILELRNNQFLNEQGYDQTLLLSFQAINNFSQAIELSKKKTDCLVQAIKENKPIEEILKIINTTDTDEIEKLHDQTQPNTQ